MSLKSLSPEHIAKIRAGHAKYFARKKELKALQPKVDEINTKLNELQTPITKKELDTLAGPSGAREHIIKKINSKRDKLLEAKIDMATGYSYVGKDGERIYTKHPDSASSEYLLNQLIGKPKESIEIKTTNLNIDI